jgi:hypothetical protein
MQLKPASTNGSISDQTNPQRNWSCPTLISTARSLLESTDSDTLSEVVGDAEVAALLAAVDCTDINNPRMYFSWINRVEDRLNVDVMLAP